MLLPRLLVLSVVAASLTGCATADRQQDTTVEVVGTLSNAYARLANRLDGPQVHIDELFYLGGKAVAQARGDGKLSLRSTEAAVDLRSDSGTTVHVARTHDLVQTRIQSPGSSGAVVGQVDLTKCSRASMPELTSPGADVVQLATLLRAPTVAHAVRAARPVVQVSDGVRKQLFEYQIDLSSLAGTLGAGDKSWVTAIIDTAKINELGVRVELHDGQVRSAQVSLPVFIANGDQVTIKRDNQTVQSYANIDVKFT